MNRVATTPLAVLQAEQVAAEARQVTLHLQDEDGNEAATTTPAERIEISVWLQESDGWQLVGLDYRGYTCDWVSNYDRDDWIAESWRKGYGMCHWLKGYGATAAKAAADLVEEIDLYLDNLPEPERDPFDEWVEYYEQRYDESLLGGRAG